MDAALSANLQDIRDRAPALLHLAPPSERRRTRHMELQRAGRGFPAQDMTLRTDLFWPQRPLLRDFAIVDKHHIAAGIHPCLPPYPTH